LPRLVYLQAARRDLLEIAQHITREAADVRIGEGFAGLIRQQCRKLASLPGTLGRRRPELHPEIRSFAYKGYIIFFRYRAGDLQVINVLEGHRDIR
jgi:toxin ParE1/3/4